MRLFIVGIGGCGGKVAERFLENQDVSILDFYGDHLSFGKTKGIWLEADTQETIGQTFFRPSSHIKDAYHPFYFIPHDILGTESATAQRIQDKYGYDIKKQGFFRQAEYLKAIFEIFESDKEIQRLAIKESKFDNPMLRETWKIIRPYTTLAEAKENGNDLNECDSILFIISLGGGTGTGFINPITKYIKAERKEYPIFVLGILTEMGEDKQQGTKEEKRDLGAVISIHDLLTKEVGGGSIDSLILMDNQILINKFSGNLDAINGFVSEAMKPLLAQRHYPRENPPGLAVKDLFLDKLPRNKPPILIPCYWINENKKSSEEDLIKAALNKGRLFWCDPKYAERAYVFARGYLDTKAIRKAVVAQTKLSEKDVQVWRKIGGGRNEVLVLLRSPYGSPGAYKIEGTFENRMYRIIQNAITYIKNNEEGLIRVGMPEITKEALQNYFGRNGLLNRLENSLMKIEKGDKQIFSDELNIFSTLKVQDKIQLDGIGILSEEQLTSIEARLLFIENTLKGKGLIKKETNSK